MAAMKLLVVDDERPIVKHMDALLTGWGHQVVSLCLDSELTPVDVLEQVKLQKFDVALVDNFKMPRCWAPTFRLRSSDSHLRPRSSSWILRLLSQR